MKDLDQSEPPPAYNLDLLGKKKVNSTMRKRIPPKTFLKTLCAGAAVLAALILIEHLLPMAYGQRRMVSAADPIGSGKNCSQIPAPAAAASAGYSNLAFCDDFNSEATIDVHGTGGPGYQ